MKILGLLFLPLAFSFICLACYGQISADPYAILNGNWHLATPEGVFKHPDQDFSFGVDGATIYGEGTVTLSCTSGGREQDMGFDVVVEGQIGPDGSFSLESQSDPVTPAHVISIAGTLPAAGHAQWSGSIAVAAFQAATKPIPWDCPALSANFAAIPFPRLNGTYSGPIRTGGQNEQGYVSLRISQGLTSESGPPGTVNHLTAAKARIQIAGSSQFPSDTYEVNTVSVPVEGATGMGLVRASACCNKVYGKSFSLLFFHKQDGSELAAQGEADPSDDSRIQLTLRYFYKDANGKTNVVIGNARLTRDEVSR